MSDITIRTIVVIPAEDLTVGMTLTYTVDGTAHARRVESIDRTDTMTIAWVHPDLGLAIPSTNTVSIEV